MVRNLRPREKGTRFFPSARFNPIPCNLTEPRQAAGERSHATVSPTARRKCSNCSVVSMVNVKPEFFVFSLPQEFTVITGDSRSLRVFSASAVALLCRRDAIRLRDPALGARLRGGVK